ncbi:MAG: hemolysin III family protein [Leptospiraceae bacterium]|nr:hemolysin III family protein [Leptospiraceae bacterium]MCB1322342.1 hemolysin III family protein [Leptospiraceae bacterium]
MYKGEKINSISHLVGAALSLGGWVVLIVFASLTGDKWRIISAVIYGFTLFLMFLFSTLYHSFRNRPKYVFRILDHIAIYLLIAGTYTPFCLVLLRDGSGWLIMGLVWGLAVIGIVFKSLFVEKFELASTAIYVLAGWTILLDIGTVWNALPFGGLLFLVLGGALYTIGAVFFLMDNILPRNHEIWHFLILSAALAHYCCVFFYVI